MFLLFCSQILVVYDHGIANPESKVTLTNVERPGQPNR